jgi:amidase
MTSDWEKIAAARHMDIEQRIPQEWRLAEHVISSCSPIQLSKEIGFLTEKESWITELRAIDLLNALRLGSLKAVEVTLAFCKRAAIAHQAVGVVSV